MYICTYIHIYIYTNGSTERFGSTRNLWVAGPQKRSQCLACGCLKPTFGRHEPSTVDSDVVWLPDAAKTAGSDAVLWAPKAIPVPGPRVPEIDVWTP